MALLVERAVKARLKGQTSAISWISPTSNLVGILGNRSVYFEGVFARLMYRSLYKTHQQVLHGTTKTALDTVANLISRRTEPRVKFH
jgi:NADH:ubiquinone reductase (H+-translocating)